jgi:hypothetical protein
MKTSRNLNSKYVMRDDDTMPPLPAYQVCTDYSSIVNGHHLNQHLDQHRDQHRDQHQRRGHVGVS